MEMLKLELNKIQSSVEDTKERVLIVEKIQLSMDSRLRELEQYSKKFNVIIRGIPKFDGENLLDIIKALAEGLEVPFHELYVSALHRLPSRGQTQPIILKLTNLDVKHRLIKNAKRKKLNGSCLGLGENPIFFDEHLTKETADLLHGAKDLRAQGKVKFAWQADGKVFVREDEGCPNIRIIEHRQLQQLATKRNLDVRSPFNGTIPTLRHEEEICAEWSGTRRNGQSRKHRKFQCHQHYPG